MSAADYYPDLYLDVAIPNHELFEIYGSKISLHRAKAGYSYPTIRLPFTFSKLAAPDAALLGSLDEFADGLFAAQLNDALIPFNACAIEPHIDLATNSLDA